MTNLEEVLKEKWTPVLNDVFDESKRIATVRETGDGYEQTRAAVVALGKRALQLLLEFESSDSACPDCKEVWEHTHECRIWRIITEAKALG